MWKSITGDLFATVPKPAMVVGLAGTIPYLGTAFGTVFLAREASRASQGEPTPVKTSEPANNSLGLDTITGLDLQSALDALHVVEHVQITYGAIILSFLGAIHWGMEFSKLGGEHGYRRLALGVIPVLYAWPTTFLPHGFALIAQWLGFTGTWMLDQRASAKGWSEWTSLLRRVDLTHSQLVVRHIPILPFPHCWILHHWYICRWRMVWCRSRSDHRSFLPYPRGLFRANEHNEAT